jgi:hypothetical protein
VVQKYAGHCKSTSGAQGLRRLPSSIIGNIGVRSLFHVILLRLQQSTVTVADEPNVKRKKGDMIVGVYVDEMPRALNITEKH